MHSADNYKDIEAAEDIVAVADTEVVEDIEVAEAVEVAETVEVAEAVEVADSSCIPDPVAGSSQIPPYIFFSFINQNIQILYTMQHCLSIRKNQSPKQFTQYSR